MPSSSAVSAAAAPGMPMPTWQTTLVRLTSPMSLMISSGPTIQPTRQPIIRYSLETLPTVTVLSARPGIRAGCRAGTAPNRIRSIAAS